MNLEVIKNIKTPSVNLAAISFVVFLFLTCMAGANTETALPQDKQNTIDKNPQRETLFKKFDMASLKIPAGFNYIGKPKFFGTTEKKFENGTIFDYIDGGGVVYIDYGFRELTHLVLKNDKNASITFDIYDMTTLENASKAFRDESICPADFIKIDIGTLCKSYRFEPERIMFFTSGRYIVYLLVDDDMYGEDLKKLAAEIFNKIKE
jgi:hypothetical protein